MSQEKESKPDVTPKYEETINNLRQVTEQLGSVALDTPGKLTQDDLDFRIDDEEKPQVPNLASKDML